MISVKLQLILLIFILLATFQLIRMITRYKLDLKYALLWLLLAVVSLCLVIFPSILYKTAELLSIEIPSNALFMLAILLVLIIIFSLTIALSRASNKIKTLSQELGILKYEFESLRKMLEKE
ncbi:DUF2304 domain-containing protein [Lysinibacillus pakistanensis]|uniref:DUF2304 domain-containing protein n=1 Tax=Lysinibacillus pakistanensis TaxID=759811 RepID=A0AAX3WX92_9BACI|nr:DUF2304 domain-containing protein [Lysinibacillus pakistanensis]MDM5231760.1 DUF2304 domain-containing protein [Lysinibacillus pakistanensis]WHY47298.1 DUF2304 domain-containing protein [Lysinibacillus pakistanensis]WHY52307.1 DUF2304 domain-containing protein [Lysinibacillus pakistanensis]